MNTSDQVYNSGCVQQSVLRAQMLLSGQITTNSNCRPQELDYLQMEAPEELTFVI